jgi:hypothetical protein
VAVLSDKFFHARHDCKTLLFLELRKAAIRQRTLWYSEIVPRFFQMGYNKTIRKGRRKRKEIREHWQKERSPTAELKKISVSFIFRVLENTIQGSRIPHLTLPGSYICQRIITMNETSIQLVMWWFHTHRVIMGYSKLRIHSLKIRNRLEQIKLNTVKIILNSNKRIELLISFQPGLSIGVPRHWHDWCRFVNSR